MVAFARAKAKSIFSKLRSTGISRGDIYKQKRAKHEVPSLQLEKGSKTLDEKSD